MIKKLLVTVAAITISMSSAADNINGTAEPIDIYVGVNFRTMSNDFDETDTNHLSGYIAFENYIPMVPNLKFKTAFLNGNSDGNSATNTILYYRFYNTGFIEADAGIAYTNIKTSEDGASIPQTYFSGRLFIPNTQMNVFGEIVQGSLVNDGSSQTELGVAYRFIPRNLQLKLAIRAGYYSQTVKFKNASTDRISEGLFIGMKTLF